MRAAAHRFAARLRSDRGQSLIEVLVVIVILAIMTVGFLTFLTGLFNTEVRAQQTFNKETSSQSALEWLNAKLGSASTLGVVNGGQINPLTLARDQVLFSDTANGTTTCYRVAYVKSSEQVLIMTAPSCTAPQITPVRGPNTGTDPNLTGTSRCNDNGNGSLAAGVDPMFDIAPGETLTCGNGSNATTYTGPNVLVSDLVSAAPAGVPASSPNPLSLFTFENSSENPLPVGPAGNGPDEQADSTSTNSWYSTPTNTNQISVVNAVLYLNAQAAGDQTPALARNLQITLGSL